MAKKKRQSGSRRKMNLIQRFLDEQDNKCIFCKRDLVHPNEMKKGSNKLIATYEHIKPKCYGGNVTQENGCTSCIVCNSRRGSIHFDTWAKIIKKPEDILQMEEWIKQRARSKKHMKTSIYRLKMWHHERRNPYTLAWLSLTMVKYNIKPIYPQIDTQLKLI